MDSGTYSYHKSNELRNYFRSSSAHNTLTVDDESSSEFGDTFSWISRAEANVNKSILSERFDFIEASHNGFRRLGGSPVDYSRSLLFLKNDYWIIRDFVKTAGEHSYQLNFNFAPETNPALDKLDTGVGFVEEQREGKVGMRLFAFGDEGQWVRKEGWVSRCYGSRQTAPFLTFVSEGSGPQEFFTFVVPADESAGRPEVHETTVEGGRAFVIFYREYQDLFVFADGGHIVSTELFNSDFNFCWARKRRDEKLPDECVLIGGKNFSLGGREVINRPKEIEFATARRFGSRLNVRTPKGLFRVSIPKGDSRTFILKSTPGV